MNGFLLLKITVMCRIKACSRVRCLSWHKHAPNRNRYFKLCCL